MIITWESYEFVNRVIKVCTVRTYIMLKGASKEVPFFIKGGLL